MKLFSKVIPYIHRFLIFFKRQSLIKKIFIGCGLVGGAVVSGLTFLFFMVWVGLLGHIPNRDELSVVENPVASEVFSADSVLLGRYFIQERSDIRF